MLIRFKSFTIGENLNERKDGTMGYGRKSQAKKMNQRTGQAKKKAKIKAKIAAGKAAKKK